MGLFTFKKVKGDKVPLRCTSGPATLDVDRLFKAQWCPSEVMVKITVTRRRGGKHFAIIGVSDLLNHLVTEDARVESFVLDLSNGEVRIDHVQSLPGEKE